MKGALINIYIASSAMHPWWKRREERIGARLSLVPRALPQEVKRRRQSRAQVVRGGGELGYETRRRGFLLCLGWLPSEWPTIWRPLAGPRQKAGTPSTRAAATWPGSPAARARQNAGGRSPSLTTPSPSAAVP